MSELYKQEPVNWYTEELEKFYEDDNKGFIWGIYSYIGEDIVDVSWFKTKEERNRNVRR